MRRIGRPKPAFVQPKGLSPSNKDAMEKMNDVVVQAVEEKSKEVEKAVGEKTDKVLDTVQDNTQKVADKVEDVVEKVAKPLTDIIDKLDDDPRVKKVLDEVTESVVQQVDGREFSCFCFGLKLSLRITRKTPQLSPSKPSAIDNKLPALPSQHGAVAERRPSKVPAQKPSATPSKKISAV